MPPELVALLSQHMDPADVAAAELVTTPSAPKPSAAPVRRSRNPFNTLYISYIPKLRSFSAHKHGIPEIRASSLPALLARIEELWPGAEFRLVLSKLAKAEVEAQRTGTPRRPEVPW